MAKYPILQIAVVATVALFALGVRPTPLVQDPGTIASERHGSGESQVRPDMDENDRWRDRNFDMEGVLDLLDVRPGMIVGDLGAGWGYMTFKLAQRVAPGGIVLSEDIDPEMIALLKMRAAERNLTNIETILGTETDPRLPDGWMDMIFMHAVLQFIADRVSFIRTAGQGLRSAGRFVIIEPETEGDDPGVGLTGPGRFPTRPGYLEIFRRAGFEPVFAERKMDWKFAVFVLKKNRRPDSGQGTPLACPVESLRYE